MSRRWSSAAGEASPHEAAKRLRLFLRNRRLWTALGISALVHLSAVTIFNVVIYFPVSEIEYFDFRFVEAPRGTMGNEEAGVVSIAANQWEWLPPLEPPNLDTPTEGRLTLSNPAIPEQSLAEEIYGSNEENAPLLGEALKNMQTSMRRLSLGADRVEMQSMPPANVSTFTPTAGFTGALLYPQRDNIRALLFAPPLQTLWGVPADQLRGGLNYTLSVDASGKVTRVWNEDLRGGEKLAAVEAQLAQYRFAPDEAGSLLEEVISLRLAEADTGL